jgi:hypothetical protein
MAVLVAVLVGGCAAMPGMSAAGTACQGVRNAIAQSDVQGALNAITQSGASEVDLDATCPADMSVFREMYGAWTAQQQTL